ncbi:hypothetical protein OPIT5_21290 [Opitutaceae bacterium TAV5]|nr:hypothetical protein OPIT5_21290 [Opitutaceae bacterium TAV5]
MIVLIHHDAIGLVKSDSNIYGNLLIKGFL